MRNATSFNIDHKSPSHSLLNELSFKLHWFEFHKNKLLDLFFPQHKRHCFPYNWNLQLINLSFFASIKKWFLCNTSRFFLLCFRCFDREKLREINDNATSDKKQLKVEWISCQMVIYVNHMVAHNKKRAVNSIAAELKMQFNSYLASDSNAMQFLICRCFLCCVVLCWFLCCSDNNGGLKTKPITREIQIKSNSEKLQLILWVFTLSLFFLSLS